MKWYAVAMIRLFRAPLFWMVAVIVCAGAFLFFWKNSFSGEGIEAQVATPSPQDIPSLQALLVQVDEVSEHRRILQCNEKGCTPKEPPKSVGLNPLSDGTSWYRYAEHDKKGVVASVLERVDNDGAVQTITEENPLVKPRAMMLSTDGTKLAYFLDNIHDELGLTELWAYDSKEGGAKVIAEKLKRKDIASRVRWNASSRIIWFLEDAGDKQLIVASLGGGTGARAFKGVSWNAYANIVDNGVMDINDDASLAAFAEPTPFGLSKLLVVRGNEPVISKSVKGDVVFVRWMEDDSLLYAVQDGKNLSFWMANAQKEWPITRMQAMFESAHSAGTSGLAAFVASPRENERHLYVLQIATGLIKDETIIPNFPGKTYVVQTREGVESQPHAVAGITSAISDGALAAFVDEHIASIAEDNTAKPSRILVTDTPNTIFIDYADRASVDQRVLVLIVDALNPEWKVIARYKAINGIWNRIDTVGDPDPKTTRLYEWEDSLSQWILKQTY